MIEYLLESANEIEGLTKEDVNSFRDVLNELSNLELKQEVAFYDMLWDK